MRAWREPVGPCRTSRARAVGMLVAIALGACGCGSERMAAPPGTDEGADARLEWVAPENGAGIADTIRVTLRLRGRAPERVALLCDGQEVSARSAPPWILTFLPGDDAGDLLALQATGEWRAAATVATPPVRIRWSPNSPPSIRLGDGFRRGAARRSSTDTLRVEAFDPEDGPLSDRSILWISEAQGLLGRGDRLPLDALIEGVHRLRIRAADRWGRKTCATVTLEIFEYGDRSTPAGTLRDARHALVAGDSDAYASCLDQEFRFLFCPSERDLPAAIRNGWDADREAAFARAIHGTAEPTLAAARWRLSFLQLFPWNGSLCAKAEIDRIEVVLAWAPGETLAVVGGRARVYLRLRGDEGWRIEQWGDLGAASEWTQGGLRAAVLGRDRDRLRR